MIVALFGDICPYACFSGLSMMIWNILNKSRQSA